MPPHRVGVDCIPCGWETATEAPSGVGVCLCWCVWVHMGECVCVGGVHAYLAGELFTGTSEDGIFSPLHNGPQELQTGFLSSCFQTPYPDLLYFVGSLVASPRLYTMRVMRHTGIWLNLTAGRHTL